MKTQHQSDEDIVQWLTREYAQPFAGWDFDGLKQRMTNLGELPWQYPEVVSGHLSHADALLDIGTGGGEVLAAILKASEFDGSIHATEGYAPNVRVAARRLAPFGAAIHDTHREPARFDDDAFDLVLNRHSGAGNALEMSRIIRPGGYLVTQQVGRRTNVELREYFDVEPHVWPGPYDANDAAATFADAGFDIQRIEEGEHPVRFMDAGALVRYLKAIPWEVPGFSIARYARRLIELQRTAISRGFAIDATFHAWLMVARKL